MGIYEFAILGCVTSEQSQSLINAIGEMASDFDLNLEEEIKVYDANTVNLRDRSAAFSSVYFLSLIHI